MIFLIDALGNLALFGLAYYWLGLPASSTGNLALSAAIAVTMLVLVAYLVALAFNRDPRAAVGRVPVMLIWLAIASLVVAAIIPVWGWAGPIGNWLASALTFSTRIPIQPSWITTAFETAVATIAGLILIGSLLPAAVRACTSGGLHDWRPVLSLRYTGAAITYAIAGLWLPWTLFWWIPQVTSFEAQMASFVLRAGLAFAIYVSAWLIFAGYCRTQTLPPER